MTEPSFRIIGLAPEAVAAVFDLDEAGLAAIGARRVVADAPDSFPCRITLEDRPVGEELVLMNYTHQPAASPYGSRGPIYVARAGLAAGRREAVDAVPGAIRRRLLSVRAYDRAGMMLDAEVVEGRDLEPLARRFLADPAVDVLHVHFARRGCYAATIERCAPAADVAI